MSVDSELVCLLYGGRCGTQSSEAEEALGLEARLALVLRLVGRRQPARRGVRVEVDGRREGRPPINSR